MNEFLIGFSSSLISSSITYPIDLIKVRLQVTNVDTKKNEHNKVITINKLATDIYKKNKIHGFYRGIYSHLMTYPIFWSAYFPISNQISASKLSGYKYLDKFVTCYGASVVASSLSNPLFVTKTRLQTDGLKNSYNNSETYFKNISTIEVIKNIYKNEGIFSFWKGLKPTLVTNLKLGVQFPFYDYLFDKTNYVFISAFLSKTIISSIAYPLDIIRTYQRDTSTNISINTIIKNIYKNHGVIGFYKGVGLYNLVTVPNFVIMMIVRDIFIKVFC